MKILNAAPEQLKVECLVTTKNITSCRIFYDYTEKYNDNSRLFLKLQEKYPKFKKAVDEFEQRDICKNKIGFCLMDPFQRLPRYFGYSDLKSLSFEQTKTLLVGDF